jgi:hypothetical protein
MSYEQYWSLSSPRPCLQTRHTNGGLMQWPNLVIYGIYWMPVRNSDLIVLNIWMRVGTELEWNTRSVIYNNMERLRKIMEELSRNNISRTQVRSFLVRVKLRKLRSF